MSSFESVACFPGGAREPTDTSLAHAMVDCLESWRPEHDRRAFHDRLNQLLDATWPMVAREPAQMARWRERLHPYFLQAPFIERAFTKPLGYGGDFELMNVIYRNAPEGPTPLGRALHQWANSFRSAAAVRTRRRWIVQQMQEHAIGIGNDGPYRILSLASGPAMELRDLVRESFLVERAELLCVDQDRQSLTHAERGLRRGMDETGRSVPASFACDSVKNLLRHGGAEYGGRQFVYAMGLYDYLRDETARALTTVLHSLLAKGGRLIVGNYVPEADGQAFMDVICDWHLIYRSRRELQALAADLAGPKGAQVLTDSTGCVQFLVVDKR